MCGGETIKINKKASVVIAAVAFLLIVGVVVFLIPGGTEGEYRHFVSTEHGFSVSYPREWTQSTASGAALYCNAPDQNASFNVQIPASAGGLTLEQLASMSKSMIENMFPGTSFAGEKDILVNGMEGHEWTIIWENFAGTGQRATVRQDFFIRNDKVYTVTFMARSECYDAYAGTFDAILNSFTVP